MPDYVIPAGGFLPLIDMLSQLPITYTLNRCIKALIGTVLEIHGNSYLHSDYWQRTIYIDTLGVGTTDFDLSGTMKTKLEQSGRLGANTCFDWYDKKASNPANHPRPDARPLNLFQMAIRK